MKMIPMLKAIESRPQEFDKRNKLSIHDADQKTFKSKLEESQREVQNNSKDDVNQTTISEKKDNEIPTVKKENKVSEENKTVEEAVENPVKKEKTENEDIKLIKNIKKSDKKIINKNKSEDEIKKTDKDTLNQSAASLTVMSQPEKNIKKINSEPKVDTETKEDLTNEKGDVNKVSLNIKAEGKEVNLDTSLKKKNKISKDETSDKESKIKVTDFRKQFKDKVETLDKKAVNKNVNQDVNQTQQVKSENLVELESGNDKTIVLGTTELSAEGEGGKAQAPVMKEASTMLKQQLKEFGNNEIVKQTRFILKDNNVGEIKLILKPEALGQVKINLNLKENSLAGQIVVENNSVKEVFNENINQLSKALEEQGYDTAKLDVSLSDKRGSNPRDNKENKQYFSERLKRFDDNGQVVRYGAPTVGINLTA